MKICSKCKTEKDPSEFYNDKSRKDGLAPQCKDCYKENRALYIANNRDTLLATKKAYYSRNRDDIQLKNKARVDANRDARNAYLREYRKVRREEDILWSFKDRIRCLLRNAFINKGFKKNSRSEYILGCSFDEFYAHIESQFTDGMGWENRTMWHIDHIIPLASAKTEEDVIRLNHHSNLQPLWAIDNLKKGSKIL